MDALPIPLVDWCSRTLGATPARVLFSSERASGSYGVELTDGREVVLKARRDTDGRAARCVAAQGAIAEEGFPCAHPLSEVTVLDGVAMHAEEFRPGGELEPGDDTAAATRSAAALARLHLVLSRRRLSAPPSNPDWMRWSEPEPFPLLWWQEPWVLDAPLPVVVSETTGRVRDRLAANRCDAVIGHADWEAQNLRWRGDELHVVHDWDSLALLPECALVGAAAGMFANHDTHTLAPLASSAVFLESYQAQRGRVFTIEELQCAWAASLWPACYYARIQVLYGLPHPALDQLELQAEQRLSLAAA